MLVTRKGECLKSKYSEIPVNWPPEGFQGMVTSENQNLQLVGQSDHLFNIKRTLVTNSGGAHKKCLVMSFWKWYLKILSYNLKISWLWPLMPPPIRGLDKYFFLNLVNPVVSFISQNVFYEQTLKNNPLLSYLKTLSKNAKIFFTSFFTPSRWTRPYSFHQLTWQA